MDEGTLLGREEAIVAVERVLGGTYDGDEAAAWIALVERSLGLETGALVALVFYPDTSGAPDDTTTKDLILLTSRMACQT